MKYFVYIHEFPNGKRYVGQTTQKPEHRWLKYPPESLVSKAINEFGMNNVKHTVYEVGSATEQNYLESYLIKYFSTTDPDHGYNIMYGGINGKASRSFITDSGREKLSNSHMGKPANNRKRIKIDGIVFSSITEACQHFHTYPRMISKWIDSGRANYCSD